MAVRFQLLNLLYRAGKSPRHFYRRGNWWRLSPELQLGTPTLILPHSKIRINIPLGKYEMAVNDPDSCRPRHDSDHQVTYTTQDLLAGKDKEMERCLKLIK